MDNGMGNQESSYELLAHVRKKLKLYENKVWLWKIYYQMGDNPPDKCVI